MNNMNSPYAAMLRQQQQAPQPMQQQSAVQRQPMQFRQQQMAQPPQEPQTKQGGGIMSMMSDERSKKEIERLESANSALSKALSSKAEYPDTSAPSSGMQALGQQSAPPSHANFPDAPDAPANRVAAQNVALQQAAPMAPAQSPPPQAQGGAFGFKPGMPDMSQLDEAYARMGRGG